MRWIAGSLMIAAGLAVVAVAMLAALPAPIDPVAWTPDPNPGLAGEYAANDKLAEVERLLAGSIAGPEDIACAADGSLYTGLEDADYLIRDLEQAFLTAW